MTGPKPEAVELLQSHKIIREMEEKTGVRLIDLLQKRIYAPAPSNWDIQNGFSVPVEFWGVAYSTDADDITIEWLRKRYASNREKFDPVAQAICDRRQRLRQAFKKHGAIIQDAALLVASVTGELNEQHKYMVFKHLVYRQAHEYELAQLVRRSEGGKATAEKRTEKARNSMATAVGYWHQLEAQRRPEHERCGIIATRMKVKPDTVRRWIRKAGLR